MKDMVSIIVPVYNAEDNIERLLNCLSNQSYKNIEIIAVNDGSKDNSLKIMKKIALTDDKIKVFDKSNGGVSSARNLGIKNATGKYLMFVDADDLITSDAVENCINSVSDFDAVQFLMNSVYSDGSVGLYANIYNDYNDGELDLNKVINLLLSGQVSCGSCTYLYKTDIIKNKNLLFDEELDYGEDFLFVLNYMLNIDSITLIAKPLYQYCETETSLTRGIDNMIRNLKKIPNLRNKVLEVIGDNKEYVDLYNIQLSRRLITYYAHFADVLNRKEFKKIIKDLNKTEVEAFKEFDKNKLGKGARLFGYLNLNNHLNLLYLYMKMINK